MQAILDVRRADRPLRIGLTCGALEENAPNNAETVVRLRHRELDAPRRHGLILSYASNLARHLVRCGSSASRQAV